MNKKEELRNKVLSKKLDMSKITQLSWSISQVEKLYSLNSEEDMENLLKAYDSIWWDFMYIAQKELGLGD